jgi:hypothetical protein
MWGMQKDSISIRELQKMNAGASHIGQKRQHRCWAIEPIRRPTVDEARAISQRYSDWQKSWSDEDWRIAEEIMAERGISDA